MRYRITLLMLTLPLLIYIVNTFAGMIVVEVSAVSTIPTIDGKPDDWGPPGFLKNEWTANSTWIPYEGIKFVVEDNSNPVAGNSYSGVHIKGVGSKFTFYDEKQVIHRDGYPVWEPYGSPQEDFDIEAVFIQQDENNIYLLIVTSLAPNAGGEHTPGDLRFDMDKTAFSGDGYDFEIGLKLQNYTYNHLNHFGIYNVANWSETYDNIPENMPSVITNGTKIGQAIGVYAKCNDCNINGTDKGLQIYIIELKIPKAALGINNKTLRVSDLSLTNRCTNDMITIDIETHTVPLLSPSGTLSLLITISALGAGSILLTSTSRK